ncbi:MAG: hypothetical protein HY902_07160 [Deltaproteobacteria bacterium]|nr:hypothetical protein [Deltaproteobacteria bacterium]
MACTPRFGRLGAWLAVVLLVSLAGCAADDAPEAITNATFWLWRNYDTATDERLAEAIIALNGSVTPVSADEPMKVLIGGLNSADVKLVGRTDVDASQAVGMLVVTEFACKLSQIEKIHTAAEQDSLHPGSYKAYKRTFVGSRDDFLAGKVGKLDWNTELTSDYATESLAGSARHVPDFGKEKSPFGAALVSRTFLTKPASGTEWPQDYQIEAYYERKPGRMVHMFAVWRQATFSGLSSDSSILQKIQMNGFVDWDKAIETACKSGKY